MSNSNFTIQLTPGYTWQAGETWSADKANLAANPTINVSGTFSSASIADNSITLPKLQSGIFTADAAGRGPFTSGWLNLDLVGSGIFTANASGRAPFANGWLNLALVGTGIFTADTAGRAPFAAGVINSALVMPDAYWYAGSSTGTGSAYVVGFTPALNTYTNPSYANYWDGLVVCFKAHTANAANATLNAGLGVKGIYRLDGTAVLASDIAGSSIVEVRYNSSLNTGAGGWQLLTPPQGSGVFSYTNASSLAASATLSTAHSLGVVPTQVRAVLVCTASDLGYASGDEVALSSLTVNDTWNAFQAFGADATNVWCSVSKNGGSLALLNKASASVGNMDTSKWKLKMYAAK
jgi:hypothetical protein